MRGRRGRRRLERVISKGEVFVPFLLPRERVPLVSRVHGAVILSSQRALRSRGVGDAYVAKLDPRHRGALLALNTPTWVPIDVGLAHYEACDRLGLGRAAIEAIGAESGTFLNETLLSVVAHLATGVGVTPWLALSNAQTLGVRTWTGGSFGVFKLGPKEARLEWIRQPVARFPYFRVAVGAFVRAICGNFARAFFVQDLPVSDRENELSYLLSWV